MQVERKLTILADAAKYDASCSSSGGKRNAARGGVGNVTGAGICHSYAPDGRCISLLKILMSNFCIYDCSYCINRVSSDTPRAKFSIDEVVDLTLSFYRRNYIEGLFLSSGVYRNADHTMEEMGEVARRLREKHRFNGYIHLKAVAGASAEIVEQAGRWADRLSANIELPTQKDLDALAPAKTHSETEQVMGRIHNRISESLPLGPNRRTPPRGSPKAFAPAGQSTQMIIGATPTTDREIIHTATRLYRRHKLRRVYYSAFSPIASTDARLPDQSPPMVREHRLYQADWLVRFYGFNPQELMSEATPNLDLRIDPKLAWALRFRAQFPVDVNRAPREMLLRVPGLGVRSVERIIASRRWRKLSLADLAKLNVPMAKTRYFVTAAGHNPSLHLLDSSRLGRLLVPGPKQLDLFSPALSARTGEV